MKAIASIFASMSLVVLMAGCDSSSVGGEARVAAKKERSTRLYVRTVPPGARIKIDGQPSGTSDRLLEFQAPADAKTVVIEVELDGRSDRQEIIIRGGEIKRVEFDLGSAVAAADGEPPATTGGFRERTRQQALRKKMTDLYPSLVGLFDSPAGWQPVKSLHFVPRSQTEAVEQRLGGKITELLNSEFQTPHGAARINLIYADSTADAEKIHAAVLRLKSDPAYCLRFDRLMVEFCGTFDVAAAKRLAKDLGLNAAKAERGTQPQGVGEPLGMVQRTQPVVVHTLPRSGDTQVDPATTEIRVTFSKMMTDGNWSWSQISDESFPETTGSPHYLSDQRTCVLPVKLQPGTTYVIWLNSQKFTNFQDTQGRPAVPYLLVFETRE